MNKKKIYLTIFVSLVFLLISIFLISAEQPTVKNSLFLKTFNNIKIIFIKIIIKKNT